MTHRRNALIDSLESRRLMAIDNAYQQLINLDDLRSRFPTINGAGQTVAVVDTGIDYRRPELGGGFGVGKKVVDGYDFVDDDADPLDTDGHGTAVASTIAAADYTTGGRTYGGIAPGARLVALRVGVGTEGIPDSRIERALRWVLDNASRLSITTVNISLGSGAYTADRTGTQFSDELATLADRGVFVAAASGNSGGSTLTGAGIAYPAADPNVFSVGAIDATDRISSFTQRSGNLDLLAPGDNVVVPGLQGEGFQTVDGTSFSSPAVAGAAALVRQAGARSAEDVASILRSSGASNFDGDTETGRAVTRQGFARLDVHAAVRMTQQRFARTTATLAADDITVLDSATDRSGVLHVAYYDPVAKDLIYAARNVDGTWGDTILIDGVDTDVGSSLSLALDSSGLPSIAYFDATRGDLKFAALRSGEWETRRVDRPKNVGQFPSLAFDSEDQPLIAYYARSGGNLRLAIFDRDTDAFSRQTIDSAGDVGTDASLAYTVVNGTVIVAIAYADRTNGDVRYARYRSEVGTDPRDASNWVRLLVDDLDGVSNIRLSLDTDQAQIAYRDDTRGDVKFAYANTPTGGTLTFYPETIASAGSLGQALELFYDDSGRPAVAYYNRSKDASYVVRSGSTGFRAVGSNGNWSSTRIGPGGRGLDVAVGRDDALLIGSNRPSDRLIVTPVST